MSDAVGADGGIGPPSPRFVLAVDTGGTKCDALLARDDGTVLGFGRCDFRRSPRGRHAGGRGRSRDAVRMAVRDALAGAPKCATLVETSGVPVPAECLRALGRPRVHRAPWSEASAALAQAGEDYGLVVLAGTGAFVYGRARDGRVIHIDGLGPLLGDYGSGFQIGHLALRAAAQAPWAPRRQTALAAAVVEALGAQHPGMAASGLVGFMLGNPDRSEVASLAAVVDREARAGDRIAIHILQSAADDQSETVRDVVDGLGLAGSEAPMIGTGSVATRCDAFWQRLCERVAAFAPGLRPVRLDRPAALGVALAVLAGLDGVNMARCRYNLMHSFDACTRGEPTAMDGV